MADKIVRRNGAHVSKGESALEAMRDALPHWIHHTRENSSYLGGIVYLPQCDCSVCGYTANNEKKKCPHCGTAMTGKFW